MTQIHYGRDMALAVAKFVAKKKAPGKPALAAALAASSACNLKCAFRAALWASAWAQVAVIESGRSRSGTRAILGSLRQEFAEIYEECWQSERLLHYVRGKHEAPDPATRVAGGAETAKVLPFVPKRETSDA